MILAVIDTNVLISALMTKHADAATARVLRAVAEQRIVPLYSDAVLREYDEVMRRPKFSFREEQIAAVLEIVRAFGVAVEAGKKPGGPEERLPHAADRIFYEIVMEKREDGAYLVTGNLKHFPDRWYIVTPSEMMAILENE